LGPGFGREVDHAALRPPRAKIPASFGCWLRRLPTMVRPGTLPGKDGTRAPGGAWIAGWTFGLGSWTRRWARPGG